MKRIMALAACAAMVVLAASCKDAVPDGTDGYGATHAYADRFASLTATQNAAVRGLDIYFHHASVGQNVYDGVTGLSATYGDAYALATSQVQEGAVGELKTWFAANDGWGDYYEGNPGWAAKVADFKARVQTDGVGSLVDVAMMKFCYIDPDADFATYRDAMLSLEAAYPSVAFVWWTMPICSEGDAARDAFNDQVRAYATAHGKYLLDIADIECHDAAGNYLTDAVGETLCADYTTDGGHLNADGASRVAKALWVLLAEIATD